MRDILIGAVELIESEFPTHSWEELTELAMDVIGAGAEDFEKMDDGDKFDFLVDGIIEKNIQR